MRVQNKINLIFEDSTKFDESKLVNSIDLIFIDGGHNYTCVKSDSEKAFKMIKKGGYIFWHDYVVIKKSCKDVVKYIHEISETKKIFQTLKPIDTGYDLIRIGAAKDGGYLLPDDLSGIEINLSNKDQN